MTLTQVGKFMPEGLRDVMSMMNMLMEAAVACKVFVKRSAGWDHNGLNLDGVEVLGRGELCEAGQDAVQYALPDRSGSSP